MRREFKKQTKRDAFMRANGSCEGCGARLAVGKFHYDHDIADGLGGDSSLQNCVVLCHVCHDEKTRKHDVPRIAKMKRIRDKHNGITSPRVKIQSRGFAKAAPQRKASAPIEKWRGF